MNFAALLDYGPRLTAVDRKEPPKISVRDKKRYSMRMVERYKSYSIDNRIASPMAAIREGVLISNVAKNLRQMCDHGLLREVGRYQESYGPVKPYLYEWV